MSEHSDPVRSAAASPAPGDAELSMRERMHAGLPYRGGGATPAEGADGVVHRSSGEAAAMAARYGELMLTDRSAAQDLLAELLGSVGEHVAIRPPLHVDYGYNIHVGSRVFANFGLTALDVTEIRIGDDVQIGPHVQLLCPTHPLNPVDRKRQWEGGLPITIEDNVWLGGGAIVLAGVTVGRDAVVAAGAVVTRDVQPGTVVAGAPARVIRRIDPTERTGQYALENFPAEYRDQVRAEEGR
ncbi:sugar O-acetyltransferase [Rothia kristinae]|uniref:sugar O-acetyltransferase n=1 Tax=Rothia kristinae TaxID=37923 RepID=UPI002E27DEC5|nr:sugar O-acetyltransferase [Rothia kristinae]MED6046569.1 sugar O-acetyltransferase [Rothia kristinae]